MIEDRIVRAVDRANTPNTVLWSIPFEQHLADEPRFQTPRGSARRQKQSAPSSGPLIPPGERGVLDSGARSVYGSDAPRISDVLQISLRELRLPARRTPVAASSPVALIPAAAASRCCFQL